tara:strand:- start:195 stop:539 length:345 start_codon:yes stop_codon:yes gene_type:complete
MDPYEVNDSHQNPYGPKSGQPQQEQGDATGGLIPYKNPCALAAYYISIGSLIPCLGFVLGVTAFVLGIVGLRHRASNPVIKGSVHAWIGILLGGAMALLWGGLMLLGFIGALLG